MVDPYLRMADPLYKYFKFVGSFGFGLLCTATPLIFAWHLGAPLISFLVGGLILAGMNSWAWKTGVSASNGDFVAEEVPLFRWLNRPGTGEPAKGYVIANAPWLYTPSSSKQYATKKTVAYLSSNTELWQDLLDWQGLALDVPRPPADFSSFEDPEAKKAFVRIELEWFGDRNRNRRAMLYCAKTTIYALAVLALVVLSRGE